MTHRAWCPWPARVLSDRHCCPQVQVSGGLAHSPTTWQVLCQWLKDRMRLAVSQGGGRSILRWLQGPGTKTLAGDSWTHSQHASSIPLPGLRTGHLPQNGLHEERGADLECHRKPQGPGGLSICPEDDSYCHYSGKLGPWGLGPGQCGV